MNELADAGPGRDGLTDQEYPQWLRSRLVNVLAEWGPRHEPADATAERLRVFVVAADELLGDGSWVDRNSRFLEASDDLTAFVEGHVFRDDEGVSFPSRGFWFTLSKETERGTLSVSVRAGAEAVSAQLSSNTVRVAVSGPLRDGARRSIASDFADSVFSAVVAAWQPDTAAMRDRAAQRSATGTSAFAPLVGQRAWVSALCGTVGETTSGVRASETRGGTLLSADDSLDSAAAASAVRATFDANGILDVRRHGSSDESG